MKTKLFLGARMTPDLKARLAHVQDPLWHMIPFEGREYVGIYLITPFPTIKELRSACHEFTESLQQCLPDLRTDTLPIVVFPQAFLG